MEVMKFIGTLFGWLLVLALIILAVAFIFVLCGVHLKKKSDTRNKPAKELLQPTEDQRRLEEIDRSIDYTVGAIQANPMSRGTAANEAHIMQLQAEKDARLARIAAHLEKITVQDAWNTFTPEQQKRFDAQVYQYSQDVGRDGVLPREVYAENRGLVFVDGRPVPKEVAARLKELQKAVAAEKERKKNMTLQPMDYPVPFTELLIYPNRITKRPKTAQVLHEEESGSYGNRSREAVYLFEENGRTVLVCEKQRQDEHSPQGDSEWSMKARLSLVPQSVHYIPLTKWALSLPWWANLRQFTDEVCVRTDGTPIWEEFKRYRLIKSSSMKNSHDQLGWNFTYDEIGLCFDSPDVWYLRRESHWREAPSGLPYNVTVVMKLLPGVEKKSDEELCGLLNSLPWWDPNSADRKMWDARNWLEVEWLREKAEFYDSMHRKNPRSDAYEKTLDEVLKQLCLLEKSKPAEEEE